MDFSADSAHPLAPTLDHVKSRRDGGSSRTRNLRLAHGICNSFRGHAAIDKLYKSREDMAEMVLVEMTAKPVPSMPVLARRRYQPNL